MKAIIKFNQESDIGEWLTHIPTEKIICEIEYGKDGSCFLPLYLNRHLPWNKETTDALVAIASKHITTRFYVLMEK